MRAILVRWAITIIAVFVASKVVPGIHFDNVPGLVIFAAILGLLNAVIKPILKVLAFPLVLVTLGLAVLVINALLFWLASLWVDGFHVDGFLAALLGSLVVSVVSWVLSLVTPD